eukprot:TRINITY_DN11800_c0_g1_i1.p1 TRINITY_DN11800_c0_g1~~TRINITY_DN11800_c0_g1_i1.p1  ORF type:complete len:129 (+),score=5.82 TRINITY_DN11800_c0_g1_i1:36-422(+)
MSVFVFDDPKVIPIESYRHHAQVFRDDLAKFVKLSDYSLVRDFLTKERTLEEVKQYCDDNNYHYASNAIQMLFTLLHPRAVAHGKGLCYFCEQLEINMSHLNYDENLDTIETTVRNLTLEILSQKPVR